MRKVITALACVVLLAGCASSVAKRPPAPGSTLTGVASWYGPNFHGKRTANGERYDMNALTAAHPSLPFGTVVRVRSLVNGRTVDVRINDRGPHIRRRIIDLSRGAANALGLIDARTGTKPVSISIVRQSAPARTP